jgi:uncharacterized protein (TIGR00251 family)
MALRVAETGGRVRFSVRVQPRASKSELAGEYGAALRIRLAAPPVDGTANDELVSFLSNTFAVARKSVRILAGETARSKLIEIEGITERAVRDIVSRMPR